MVKGKRGFPHFFLVFQLWGLDSVINSLNQAQCSHIKLIHAPGKEPDHAQKSSTPLYEYSNLKMLSISVQWSELLVNTFTINLFNQNKS